MAQGGAARAAGDPRRKEPAAWSDVAGVVASCARTGGLDGLNVAVVGATGNFGTSVVDALAGDDRIGRVIGLARRVPSWQPPKTTWVSADIVTEARLAELFRAMDVVVHLAWLFQPTHRPVLTWRTNVLGSVRVYEAAADAAVPALIHASSVGAYSPGPKDRKVDESWPTHGWPDAAYCREKAYLERYLDGFERRYPWIRVVRMRPGFLFKREAAAEQRRLFAGPLLPQWLARPELLPVVPDVPGLRFQTMHTDDAADAVREAATSTVHGAFNLAAEPVVDATELGRMFDARPVRVPAAAVRAALRAGWRTRMVPASPHLFDAVLRLPLMDTSRAREELHWYPRHSSTDALREFVRGLREHAGMATPPLRTRLPGGRLEETAKRVRAAP
ncbi:NAD-dependent epimerase/dehydratase family protein [Streptomyces sp. JJ36]|uniref:NAD-dependent epimerase/dehydratase family protein n=1 Tax=Streptomyces sp. JJ36 TaxID=2736645 RepID=UPI001F01B4A7|nr:NAD-dependent epimerase/dehydratase family protein [Streptomyces sp. JJ36]MCF6522673.1 NAD-dependent epimerase/dehydratase family protein [Streptomyces sp. JJ36]